MLTIYTEHNKQPITYTYTFGQNFPDIKGKLIRLELSGKELQKYDEAKELPLHQLNNVYLTWHSKHVGRVLKTLREIL